MRFLYMGLFAVVFLFTGCATTLQEHGYLTPSPAKSEYFETSGAGFVMDTKEPDFYIQYVLGLRIRKSFENGAFLEIIFENPEDAQSPIIVTRQISPNDTVVDIKSPKIHGLRSHEGYIVLVKIYQDDSKDILLSEHRQVIQSIMDERMLSRIRKR